VDISDSIRISIEYSDFAVAAALQSVFDGWVSALPERTVNPAIRFINNTDFGIGDVLAKLVVCVPICYAVLSTLYSGDTSTQSLFALAFSVALIGMITFSVFGLFWRMLDQGATALTPYTRLSLTTGDEREHAKNAQSKKDVVKFTVSIVGIAGTVFLNVISNSIFSSLGLD
jgi:hypothetical protein